jgi:DNA adenine methylase
MNYPGGKGKTFQHVINLMPPHEVYIETHLGGGAVLRHKRPAAQNIAIDIDGRALQAWTDVAGLEVQLVHAQAEDFLKRHHFVGKELLYVDPPYLPETRRRDRVYRHEYDTNGHRQLLELLLSLPCMVMISGYGNTLYDELLTGWNKRTYNAKTHVEVREETLWFNYEPPVELHDSRYLGDTFRHRQSTKRRLERMKCKFDSMAPQERNAFMQWLNQQYPVRQEAR